MTPIITPAPKKKRLTGVERLQIDIPSADVKKEQRKRRHDSSQEGLASFDDGLPVSPCRNDLLCIPVTGSDGNITTNHGDNNGVVLNLSDDSDNESLSSNSYATTDTSISEEEDTEEGDYGLGENKYLNHIVDFNALKVLNLSIQLTPVWCIALSYKKVMATTLLQILLLPVVLVTM